MHLRHGHGDAAGEAGDHQERLKEAWRDAGEAGVVLPGETIPGRLGLGRPGTQDESERRYGDQAEHADTDMGGAPACGFDEILDDRRPDSAGKIAAAGGDRHGDAAVRREPTRDIGDHRAEGRRAAQESDQHPMGESELPERLRLAGKHISRCERDGAEAEGKGDAEAVHEASHEDAAGGKADHEKREGEGGIGTGETEVGFDGRHDHGDRPQPDAADRGDDERDDEAEPGVGRFGHGGGQASRWRRREIGHGRNSLEFGQCGDSDIYFRRAPVEPLWDKEALN